MNGRRPRGFVPFGTSAAFVLLIVGTSVTAQPPSTAAAAQVHVAVTDATGKPVRDLTAHDFVVKVGGTDRRVVDLRQATEALCLVMVIDTDLQDRLPVRAAVLVVADSLRRQHPDARLGLTLLQNPAVRLLSPSDAAGIERIIGRFVTGYSLLPGIVEATKVLRGAPTARRVVFAITRGPSFTGFTAEQAARALHESKASLWAIEIAALVESTAGIRGLTTLTRLSGGLAETIHDSLSLEAATERMLDVVTSQYLLSFERSTASGAGELRVGVRREGIKVFAPAWAE